ncbi:MAG: alpha/beta hydrolase-fold protein [Chloroflexota bacterium]
MAATPSGTAGSGWRGRRRALLGALGIAALAVVLAAGGILVLRDARAPVPQGVRSLTLPSTALGRAMPLQAWVPPGIPEGARLPVVVLLHGAGGGEATWFGGDLLGGGLHAEAVAAELIAAGRIPPVVLVAPAIDDSYGVDSPPAADRWTHGAYETYLRDELLPALPGLLSVSAEPGGTYLAGLSMGGFAALHLGLRDPARVAGIGALSPALWVDLPADRAWIEAPGGDRASHDPLELARTADLDGLRLFLGRGDADDAWIVDGTSALAARFAERGRDVTPVEVHGGHDASTWMALTGPMLEALLGR